MIGIKDWEGLRELKNILFLSVYIGKKGMIGERETNDIVVTIFGTTVHIDSVHS